MTPFARAYSRSRRTQTPALYFTGGQWRVTYTGYADNADVAKAIAWRDERNA